MTVHGPIYLRIDFPTPADESQISIGSHEKVIKVNIRSPVNHNILLTLEFLFRRGSLSQRSNSSSPRNQFPVPSSSCRIFSFRNRICEFEGASRWSHCRILSLKSSRTKRLVS